jgi:extracellular factor (EF) 3-hydroxypalmitic acid methyl ester biosynthesis protein
MNHQAIKGEAHLVAGEKFVPIDFEYTSKYSLLVRFLNGDFFGEGSEFSALRLPVNGDTIELGPCRLISELNIDGFAGRLVFTNDVYDLNLLFNEQKVVKLQSTFLNLPLVLSHKNQIRESFREYTANLTYDLNVYKSLFDRLDAEYQDEPDHIRALVQQAVIDTEGRKLMQYLDQQLDEFGQIVGDFKKDEHERHGFYFRRQLWNIILCAPFMARTNLKPRGYSGDSRMMQMIYSNDYQGDSTFAKLMHKHPVEHPAAQAVRNRRTLIADRIRAFSETHPVATGARLKVLSVACGPACEIQDILVTGHDYAKYHFTLLDQDRYALFEAAGSIDQIEKSFGTKIKADYLNESVRTMLATPQLKHEWGQFHFIYSMGLFDYLTPPVAKAVLEKLYSLLMPGGELIVGNYHVSNPGKYYMEYWLDWVLYYRTEKDFLQLTSDMHSKTVNVAFDNTRIQMFLHVKRDNDA